MVISVYILKCSDNSFYTGMTKNLNKRINQHESGRCFSTRKKRPLELIYFAECDSYKNGRMLEKIIKNTGASRYLDNMRFTAN